MGKKSRQSSEKRRNRMLNVGEVIRATDAMQLLPEGIYKVDEILGPMVFLSAGQVKLMVPQTFLIVLERNLEQPMSWLFHEQQFILNNPCAKDCPECQKLREAVVN